MEDPMEGAASLHPGVLVGVLDIQGGTHRGHADTV